MPIILLVEDSDVDRAMITGLLNADVDWLMSYAKNGAEAMRMLADATPDVVVTDLVMPEMDGMELVSQMAVSYPEVPVVLVTSHDDVKMAFKALRAGASSYVPKAQLNDRLLDTVEQVLSVRNMDHHDKRIAQITTNTRYRFILENDPLLIAPLVDRIQQGMIGMQLCSPTQRMHVGIALEEALTNAIFHGNLELPAYRLPEIRHLIHEGRPSPLVQERREESPYKERRVHVAVDFTRDRVQLVVSDEGNGFDVDVIHPKSINDIIDGQCGRGLLLIRTFMSDVLFNKTGSEVRMILNNPLAAMRPKMKVADIRD
ncbi:Nitrogen regulation protein NR(I) [Novipirellula aureliae]|uniref:Nitrogen regulation protein NR(I) n=1 Tax=Novipirellula aureliae TaxID=2527966 RepID=A0A5C6DHC2_9BACT|nr:response regulator [Novipirellula aureliae]TWU35237.1 Nitrogen regulation protein NR(I) [Novipirellula aureliae]